MSLRATLERRSRPSGRGRSSRQGFLALIQASHAVHLMGQLLRPAKNLRSHRPIATERKRFDIAEGSAYHDPRIRPAGNCCGSRIALDVMHPIREEEAGEAEWIRRLLVR